MYLQTLEELVFTQIIGNLQENITDAVQVSTSGGNEMSKNPKRTSCQRLCQKIPNFLFAVFATFVLRKSPMGRAPQSAMPSQIVVQDCSVLVSHKRLEAGHRELPLVGDHALTRHRPSRRRR